MYACIWVYMCVYVCMYVSVVGCTDLSGKELHRHVAVEIVVTSGKRMWCNGSTLAQNARHVSLILAPDTVVPIFITPMTERHDQDHVKAVHSMVVEATLCIYAYV